MAPSKKKAGRKNGREQSDVAEKTDRTSTAAAPPLGRTIGYLVAAWLVPGGGHFLLGDRRRAAGFCALLLVTFGLGAWLEGALYWDLRSGSGPLVMLASLANLGAGLPFLILQFFADYGGNPRAAFFEHGTAFFITAGLFNVVLLLNVWDLLHGLPMEAEPVTDEAPAEEGEAR